MTAPRQIRPLLPVLLACAMGAAFTVTVAKAETAFGVRSAAEAKANYQHDVAACKSRSVDEDTKTCLLEAKRAYDDERREAMHASGKSHMRVAKKATTESKTSTSTSGTGAGTETKVQSSETTKSQTTEKSQTTQGKKY